MFQMITCRLAVVNPKNVYRRLYFQVEADVESGLYLLTGSLSLSLFFFLVSLHFLSLEDEGIFTTSSSMASTPQSQDTIQEVNILPNEASPDNARTVDATDA